MELTHGYSVKLVDKRDRKAWALRMHRSAPFKAMTHFMSILFLGLSFFDVISIKAVIIWLALQNGIELTLTTFRFR